jgi:outer membrane protein TolC
MKKLLITVVCSQIVLLGVGQQKLSAEDAVFRALENNFQLQIAQKQLEISEKNNKWSEAGLFPTVDLTATIGSSIIDNTNNPFTFTPGLLYAQQTTPGITMNWNLFSGLNVVMSKRRLEQLEEQTKGNALVVVENTALEILKAYYNAILQKQRLEVLRDVTIFSQKQVDYEFVRKEYGQSNSLALFSLQNQLLTDSINVIQQQINFENSLRNLMILMNNDPEELINNRFPVLTDSLNKVLNPFQFEELIQEMRANNQNLKNQYINLELQKTTTQLQRSFLYPTLGLQVGASPNYGSFRSISDGNLSAETEQITYFGNINLRYNLFNNWKNKRAVEVSKIQEQIATLTIQDLELQLTNTAMNLYSLWTIRQHLIQLARANVDYAEKALEIARTRYELGSINSIELSTIQNNYLNAQLNYLDNLYQRMDIYLELYRLSGRLQLERN